jgi:hypothetical protein
LGKPRTPFAFAARRGGNEKEAPDRAPRFHTNPPLTSRDFGFPRFLAGLRGRAPHVRKNAWKVLLSRASRDDDADGLLLWSVGRFSLHIIVRLNVRGSVGGRPATRTVRRAALATGAVLSHRRCQTRQSAIRGLCSTIYRAEQPAGDGWLLHSETLRNDTIASIGDVAQAAPLRARKVLERSSDRSTVTVHPR